MIFKASLDKLARVVTAVITILFAIIIVGMYLIIGKFAAYLPTPVSLIFLVIYIMAYGMRPLRYEITAEALVVVRPFSKIRVPTSEIRSVKILDKDQIIGSSRIGGSTGLFGYYGIFSNPVIGRMKWYVTRMDRPILIRTLGDKIILLSPDETMQFVKELAGFVQVKED